MKVIDSVLTTMKSQNLTNMTAFPKLPGKSNCLGFRKTIVLDLAEHVALNELVDDALTFCEGVPHLKDSPTKNLFLSLREKLNSPTPSNQN